MNVESFTVTDQRLSGLAVKHEHHTATNNVMVENSTIMIIKFHIMHYYTRQFEAKY